ncbi:MAG: type 1 glutamine amidotransferase [Deltaproteobacteria bacterium]|nr:type 1 glutamine amidotransferase [Deltaproteobacteria bacterium]
MKRITVIQHEAYEVLGTLDPLLKKEGLRIRYVNFERHPEANPSLEKYDGLILMGGYMGVYETERYTHLKVEMGLIEQALKRKLPVLGICLGAQILAHVLGADVRKNASREMGWYDLHLTNEGQTDSVLGHFQKTEKVFQSHGDTFDIPKTARHLAWSELCPGQAFRHGDNVYGLQFHLEVDRTTVDQWLELPENQEIFRSSQGRFVPGNIKADTEKYISNSMALSTETFLKFLRMSGKRERFIRIGSGHE